ncbi:hypothetical protein B0H13DRAFT_2300007 [Mycena leptocephala]|nr:hypothetical protein B0H13DRAFT_2300007 [Mycena leptocephala]
MGSRLPAEYQLVRSLWKEDYMDELRTARHVKVEIEDRGPELAEVLFFMILEVEGEEKYLALASFFGPPDPHLLEISSSVYWSAQHLRDSDIRVIELTSIVTTVIMAPDHQYCNYRTDGSEIDRWLLSVKPGLKLAAFIGEVEIIMDC